jgi:hypothetical protein
MLALVRDVLRFIPFEAHVVRTYIFVHTKGLVN